MLKQACGFVLLLILGGAVVSAAEGVHEFKAVKVRLPKEHGGNRPIEKDVDLVFDSNKRTMTVKGIEVEARVEDVVVAVAERSTHHRGVSLSLAMVSVAAAAARANTLVSPYLLYVEVRPGAKHQRFVLEIDESISEKCLGAARAFFWGSLQEPRFPAAETISEDALPRLKADYKIRVRRQGYSMPEPRPGKALVMAVSPAIKVSGRAIGKGGPIQLLVDGEPVAVNRLGTFSYGYVEPGERLVATRTKNRSKISGMKVKLEAGAAYYFAQNLIGGWTAYDTALTMHSKELVEFEASNAVYAQWK